MLSFLLIEVISSLELLDLSIPALSYIRGGTLEKSEMMDLDLLFLVLKTSSSYPDSSYFLTHFAIVTDETLYSSEISAYVFLYSSNL